MNEWNQNELKATYLANYNGLFFTLRHVHIEQSSFYPLPLPLQSPYSIKSVKFVFPEQYQREILM